MLRILSIIVLATLLASWLGSTEYSIKLRSGRVLIYNPPAGKPRVDLTTSIGSNGGHVVCVEGVTAYADDGHYTVGASDAGWFIVTIDSQPTLYQNREDWVTALSRVPQHPPTQLLTPTRFRSSEFWTKAGIGCSFLLLLTFGILRPRSKTGPSASAGSNST